MIKILRDISNVQELPAEFKASYFLSNLNCPQENQDIKNSIKIFMEKIMRGIKRTLWCLGSSEKELKCKAEI
ncbi:CLUMA_CG016904, isoform A [Clunio marinus]|uniref:CLUMA_CG016904, isoform A n=1 Tax=Clunio marinus TaxID=568069 RepID=A0A1J1ITH1_9DIPT|nr:CLUMA_CG016904, isoform A [Clunio marinus]